MRKRLFSFFTDLLIKRSLKHSDCDPNSFIKRALGNYHNEKTLLLKLKCNSLDEFVSQSLPTLSKRDIAQDKNLSADLQALSLDDGYSEYFMLTKILPEILSLNRSPESYASFLGQGYYGCITPEVIIRNVLQNPRWYTAYTPYQAEISQGRLKALFLYQYMITELTGMDISNASLLDEPGAVAEAISMALAINGRKKVWVSQDLFVQTKAVIRGKAFNNEKIELVFGKINMSDCELQPPVDSSFSCVIIQSPDVYGNIVHTKLLSLVSKCQQQGLVVVFAVDLLSLTIHPPPSFADIVVGTSQRLGMPLGYGGPGSGFIACKMKYVRKLPGRIVGESVDADGHTAYRLSLQTREQHIRKEKAMSNICTAQVLPAIVSAFYCIYHGPEGLISIAARIHRYTAQLKSIIVSMGYDVVTGDVFFDTIAVRVSQYSTFVSNALSNNILVSGYPNENMVLVTISETTSPKDLIDLCLVFSRESTKAKAQSFEHVFLFTRKEMDSEHKNRHPFLQSKEFLSFHSEQIFTRFLFDLVKKDVSLVDNMIPLGSCTMKLNPSASLVPLTMSRWNNLHPLVPLDWAKGYQFIIADLKAILCFLTGFTEITFQPASGAQAELTALYMLRKLDKARRWCLIPESAHGTNFSSASIAGFVVRKIKCCQSSGSIDLESLEQAITDIETTGGKIGCMMITVPSTFGVEEPNLEVICERIHQSGGLVYLDGANLNSFIGICRVHDFGIDMMHINMHKTLSIPHGGGGPGMGPLLVSSKLAPFLPTHPFPSFETDINKIHGVEAVSGAPYSSASLLIIPWLYLRFLGYHGIRKSAQHALANSNYLASSLEDKGFKIKFKNASGLVAHEFVTRPQHGDAAITPVDVAKRLQDYGFHAPTVSWPVLDCLLVEPTESESLADLDAFSDVMGKIAHEITSGETDLLKSAPHLCSPSLPLKATVRRVDEEHGDSLLNRSCCAWRHDDNKSP